MSSDARGIVVVTLATLRDWPLDDVGNGTDKNERGRVLVVGGSASSPGAVRLAGEAALRAGAGKVRLATVRSTAAVLGMALPEAGVVALPETDQGHVSPAAAAQLMDEAEQCDAVLFGPGLTGQDEVVALAGALLGRTSTPVVLDALGSAYLTDVPDGLSHLGGAAVLTVNSTELACTAGRDDADVEEDARSVAVQVAGRSDVVVLHGGTEKVVVSPDGSAWVVTGGGPGLGVSGSGDVQAGLVAGLLSRGAEPAQAAVWGAFLHAQAGERLIERIGQLGFLPSELLPEVPSLLDLTR